MFSTLRSRLIASHILPLLITIPIMGIALIYVLGNRLVLDETSQQLRQQASLVVELAQDRPAVWDEPATAHTFTAHVSQMLGVQVSLLGADGRVLATSGDLGAGSDGVADASSTVDAIGRTPVATTLYSQRLHSDVTILSVPVFDADQRLLGAVRLSDEMAAAYAPYQRLRIITVIILLFGFGLSIALGWVLALDLERPLNRVTLAVQGLANGLPAQLPSEGRISEIDQLAQAFNVLQNRLNTSEETRRQLLANIIHELGRPLGALHSAAQALLNGADRDRSFRLELLTGMDEELQRLHRLLHDLTQIDQQPTLPTELRCRPVTMSEWLPTVLAARRELALAKDISWQTDIPPNLPVIYADPDRVGQAIGNLVHNAIQYTPRGGTVSVTAGSDGDGVWVRISDTGPGMSADEQARVFDAFYRGHSVSPYAPGMGLGLTIARDVVVAHGGRLDLASTPGDGSTFTLWLPVRNDLCR